GMRPFIPGSTTKRWRPRRPPKTPCGERNPCATKTQQARRRVLKRGWSRSTPHPPVDQRAPRRDDEGDEVRQRHLPHERRRPVVVQQEVALVDREEDCADNGRDRQRAPEHGA